MRTTKKDLDAVCSRINRILGTPDAPYMLVDGRYVPQADCYHLDETYGGYALYKMSSNPGCTGVTDIFGGHWPKKELYNRMQAFISGLEASE